MIRWSFWVDPWEHPFNTWNRFYSVLIPLASVEPSLIDVEPIPVQPAPVQPEIDTPRTGPGFDEIGWMSAGPITQWQKANAGSVTVIPSGSYIDWSKADFTTPFHHQYAEWVHEEGYDEAALKVALLISSVPTLPLWMIEGPKNLLPEKEFTAA